LARALRALPFDETSGWLRQLSADPSPRVAALALESLGESGDPEAIEYLVSELADRRLRRAASLALARFGERAVSPLVRTLTDLTASPVHRSAAARTLGRIPLQAAVEGLLQAAPEVGASLRVRVFKALNRLRLRAVSLKFERRQIEALALSEVEWFSLLRKVEACLPSEGTSGERLLQRAVREKRAEALDRLFRCLALEYPPRDIYNAFLGVSSVEAHVRANAIEFLEHVLEPAMRRVVLPLVEEDESEGASQPPPLPDHGFALLARARDSWLRACAAFGLGPRYLGSQADLFKVLLDDRYAVVREAAEVATRVMEREGQSERC
jgi:hypothetical protein